MDSGDPSRDYQQQVVFYRGNVWLQSDPFDERNLPTPPPEATHYQIIRITSQQNGPGQPSREQHSRTKMQSIQEYQQP